MLTRSDWILVYWNASFWMELSNKKITQNPWKCFLKRATNVTFSLFRLEPMGKPRVWNGALHSFIGLINKWITESIRGQTFWGVVFFAGHVPFREQDKPFAVSRSIFFYWSLERPMMYLKWKTRLARENKCRRISLELSTDMFTPCDLLRCNGGHHCRFLRDVLHHMYYYT
jgi:hypothetical protein